MGSTARFNAYQRVDIETASPGKIVVMLFGGAIKRSEEAKRSMVQGDIAKTHEHLVRAQEILSELRSALDMNAGEVSENLDRIYEYLHHRLVMANIKKDPEIIDGCLAQLRTLRDTWQEVCDQQSVAENPSVVPVHNAHGHTIMNFEG